MAIILPEGTQSEILKVAHFSDSTLNIQMSDSSAGTILTFTYARVSASSQIILNGYAPVAGQNSYHAGCYVEVNGHRKYEASHYTSPPGGSGDDDVYGNLNVGGMWSSTDLGSTTGNITIKLGWQSRNGSAQRPGNHYNPHQRSGRIQSRTTQITIFELVDNTRIT